MDGQLCWDIYETVSMNLLYLQGTTSDAKSCHDGRGNTKSIKSSSQLPVIEENKESEDDLLLATVRSDFIGCSHHTSVESAIIVQFTNYYLAMFSARTPEIWPYGFLYSSITIYYFICKFNLVRKIVVSR